MNKTPKIRPIVKWVGGKRGLLGTLLPIVKNISFDTYIEPFLGGGAMAFALAPTKAILCDKNKELMNVYSVVRDSLDDLEILLQIHEKNNSSSYFYRLRELDRRDIYKKLGPVEKAARFIYMNKTAYNGLYRVNKKGQCNMPYGKYVNPVIDNHEDLSALSYYLNQQHISTYCNTYSVALEKATDKDFIYMDPPYCPVSKSAAFTAYNSNGFSLEDQKKLCEWCHYIKDKGISFMQSNADTPFIRDLYKDYAIVPLTARRSINSKGDKRTGAKEVLIVSGQAETVARKFGMVK